MKPDTAKSILSFLAIMHIIIGITLPFLVETRLFDYYNHKMLAAFNSASHDAMEIGKFMLGILGPSIASWGILFLFLVRHAYQTGSKSAFKVMLVAIVGWSSYDMALSLMAGVYLNIIIDMVVMTLLLTPIILTRSHFLKNIHE